jgi:hypothetical protein
VIDFGKLLFPKAQRHERKRHLRALLVAVVVGIVLAAVVVGIIYLIYQSDRLRR